MDMKRVEAIEKKYKAISNERMYGKGMRYDKNVRADQMAVDFEGAMYVDELLDYIKQQHTLIERYKEALKKINDSDETDVFAYGAMCERAAHRALEGGER